VITTTANERPARILVVEDERIVARDLADTLRWVKFSNMSWTRDNKGFFYSRYPEPPKGKVLEAALANQALYYHRVGTPQSEDKLIYARKDLPSRSKQYVRFPYFHGSVAGQHAYISQVWDGGASAWGGT